MLPLLLKTLKLPPLTLLTVLPTGFQADKTLLNSPPSNLEVTASLVETIKVSRTSA